MPDNEEPGILENFLEKLISGDDPCWSHAHEATVRAGEIGAPFQNYIKARLHTWLAWREPPGQPFGTAMTARCFQSDTDDALRFVDWFRRIFPESTPPAPASESITSEETPQLSAY